MKRAFTQKADWKTTPVTIEGPGRVDDSKPIDFSSTLYFPYAGYPVKALPRCKDFSLKIGNTIYDVKTHFSTDGRQTVLQQFRDLILSEHLI